MEWWKKPKSVRTAEMTGITGKGHWSRAVILSNNSIHLQKMKVLMKAEKADGVCALTDTLMKSRMFSSWRYRQMRWRSEWNLQSHSQSSFTQTHAGSVVTVLKVRVWWASFSSWGCCLMKVSVAGRASGHPVSFYSWQLQKVWKRSERRDRR